VANPATSNLFAAVSETPAVQTLARRLEDGGVLSSIGISQTAQPFFAAFLNYLFPERPIVVVTEGLKMQESFQEDVSTWLGTESKAQSPKSKVSSSGRGIANVTPLFYPPWEILPHESKLPHADVISERLETLITLTHRSSIASATEGHASRITHHVPLVVTSIAALLQRTFPRQAIAERTRLLKRGERIDPLDLVEWLEAQAYEPEAQVTQKGEIALRGGILDVYPITSPWPVRLEFFGDELESLRHFDPLTQISREEITEVTIPPGGELGILKKESADLGILLDYLPQRVILLLCEPDRLDERASEYGQQVPDGDPFYISWEKFKDDATRRGMTLLSAKEGESDLLETPDLSEGPEGEELPLPFQNLDAYRPLVERLPEPQVAEAQRREFFAQLHRWLRQDYAVHVFCNNDGERQRFGEIWEEYGFGPETPTLHIGALARGFLYDQGKLVVITDAEIFGRYKIQRPRRLKSAHAQATRSALDIDFAELEEGDFVVHLQHGIGRYLGLQVLPIGAGTKPTELAAAQSTAGQECLVIEYAPNDPAQPPPKLYVPVTEAHLVSKYVGTGKARPPLNTLGGTRWAKAKAQAERAVKDVASELLSIQAARDSQPGHSFAPDTPWQREFEGAFIYEETPDQLRAIGETKADMERAKPMDRLICGDVGFGKTEVGIRAAFKAVMDGKQVAVLVPTTVLAQQHYNTFRERMAEYPVRVELLSRFRTRRAQQQVVKDLAAGSVDIVIGTHRLLQGDIAFKDLGLVVIDEEQRFGVLHKEKFKMLRKLVDVLTLSATPIPRTLYLALTGARDMSTIQTPPHDRLPVETIVTQYDERVIRDAIRRELNRGGQVFFLHNRVMTIDTMAQKLATLLPDARLVVGHGQMHSDDLEEVMTKFVNGEADVLLSTTIIESGLDIPNANTIIIDRADRFGLSDLYQLRGRVGRYKHQAYAYLLLPRHAGLVADVRKRLSAIKQYSTLGSGFKIAMRDLEIRGAGNLLGAEQSGHITAVGFELYCQLLKQSVASQKGEKVKPRIEVQVRLDFLALSPADESPKPEVRGQKSDVAQRSSQTPAPLGITQHATRSTHSASIPFKYISDARQRIEIYRKLAQATNKASLQALEKEVRDRFGPVPPALQLLLLVGELKILASDRGITAIEVKDDRLMLTRNNDYIMIGSKFPRLTKSEPAARLKEIKKLIAAL
jgi:transcription-repair coupling factor (superfamily II helicase)